MRDRKALTLVETLVGCLFISVLTAISLPAVNAIRMDAKAIECANRIRSICIASHNYHDAYKRLPAGTLGVPGAAVFADWNQDEGEPSWLKQQNTSALGAIGHFIELNTLMDKCDPFLFDMRRDLNGYVGADGLPVYKKMSDIIGVGDVGSTEVDIYLCPSDDLREQKPEQYVIATQPVIREANLADDMGLKYCSKDDAWVSALTNYIGNGGVGGGESTRMGEDVEKKAFSGPLMSRTKMVLEAIFDGTSNTIMFGENVGEIENGKRTAASVWLFGGRGRGRGNVPWYKNSVPDNAAQRILGDANWSSVVGFGSKHEAGVNFARCDGSVMMLT